MMNITEKVAYLKGLVEGLKLDEKDDTVKVINAIIDVLDDILELYALFQNSLFEWVQIDYHHVDRFDALVLDGTHVFGYVPAGKDSCMDFGVKGLDTTIQHLRESCDVRDLCDLYTVLFQKLECSACGDDVHAGSLEFLSEVHYPVLVGNADYCPFYLSQMHTPSVRGNAYAVCIL